MTNYQWALAEAAVSKILYTVDLGQNRLMIVYNPWTKKRGNWVIICKGVRHHNDKWKITHAGPLKKSSGKLEIPYIGPEGYNR